MSSRVDIKPPNPARGPGDARVCVGLAGIILLESLLFLAVRRELPAGLLANIGWAVRVFMTPLAWSFYLVFLTGLLGKFDGISYMNRFRRRFWICWLWSIPCWAFFDWINFYFMRDPATGQYAWQYGGMPRGFWLIRLPAYFVAFGAVLPGMFLSADVFMRLGLSRLPPAPVRIPRPIQAACLILGVLFFIAPFVLRDPISNLLLWVSLIFLLDPFNHWSGRPSIIGDWLSGRFGRTLALMVGGLWCGLLWEFWNYWALAKWKYHLPFLGAWQHIRYFQMPVPGLIGFMGFGIETWVMWQTGLIVLGRCVEGERRVGVDAALADVNCL